MSKAKPKTTTKKSTAGKLSRDPDRKLIAACISYSSALQAGFGALTAVPGGDCDKAMPIFDRHYARAVAHLVTVTNTPAQTVLGLSAKARLVPLVFKDDEQGALSEGNQAFVVSFAADTVRIAEVIAHAEKHGDEKGGAA